MILAGVVLFGVVWIVYGVRLVLAKLAHGSKSPDPNIAIVLSVGVLYACFLIWATLWISWVLLGRGPEEGDVFPAFLLGFLCAISYATWVCLRKRVVSPFVARYVITKYEPGKGAVVAHGPCGLFTFLYGPDWNEALPSVLSLPGEFLKQDPDGNFIRVKPRGFILYKRSRRKLPYAVAAALQRPSSEPWTRHMAGVQCIDHEEEIGFDWVIGNVCDVDHLFLLSMPNGKYVAERQCRCWGQWIVWLIPLRREEAETMYRGLPHKTQGLNPPGSARGSASQ